jgi:catechol 2,3-dioxygenase-like lactoylglutathione lyase family enzyme
MAAPPKIRQVVETALYVEDFDRSRKFYEDVLGLRFVSRGGERDLFFAAGQNMLLLFQAEQTLKPADVPSHGATGIQHVAFEIDAGDYEEWKRWLTGHGITILKETTWQAGAISGRSLYFPDPDGHVLELITRGAWAPLR